MKIYQYWNFYYVFSVLLCLLCLCTCLFICVLWSPAGKGLTSWLFVVSNCEFVTFPLVSWVKCGTWLYWFLIFAPLLTLWISFSCVVVVVVVVAVFICLYMPVRLQIKLRKNPPMLLGVTVISSCLAWYGLKIMNGICVGVSNISNNCRFQDLI